MDVMGLRRRIMLNEPHIDTPASASLQNFRTDLVAPLKECKVHFSPVQEGTGDPSPDNVRPISGWTGCEVYRTKQNMIDLSVPYQNPSDTALVNTTIRVFKPYTYSYGASYSNWWQPHQIVSCSIEGNKLRVTTNSTAYGVGFAIPVKAGWVMRLSYNSTGRTHIAYYDRWGKYITGGPTNTINLTVPNQAAIGLIIFESYPSGTEVVFSDIMLTVQTASAYEPYQGKTLSIDWTTEAGTVYGGYVDLVTGEVWETCKKISITQTMSQWNSWGKSLVYNTGIMGGSNKRKAGTVILCDGLTPIGGTVDPQKVTSTDEIRYYGVNVTYPQYLFMANPDRLTIQEWRSWLTTTYPSVHISFELETPVLIATLTPTQLKTLRGTNNIWSNANGNIDISYWAH